MEFQHDIFVSYAREDMARVEKLVHALEELGLSCWWDRRIPSGDYFDEAIDAALAGAGCVLVAWSHHSVASEWVRAEAEQGLGRGALIPILLDEVVVPLPFRRLQAAQLIGWPRRVGTSREFKRLVLGLSQALEREVTTASVDVSIPVPGFQGRAAIAVLPFENKTGDPSQEYFADGVTGDVIRRLQLFHTFPVIAHTSTAAYRGHLDDLASIADELGAGYLVLGEVRQAEARLRIDASLVDSTSLHTLWKDCYDREVGDIFALQDDISRRIAAILEPEVTHAEQLRPAPRASIQELDSWDLLRQGMWHQRRLTRDDARQARRLFDLALQRDPHSFEAIIQLAWWHFFNVWTQRLSREQWKPMEEYAQRALAIEPRDSRALLTLGVARMMLGDPDLGRIALLQAIEQNPSLAWAYSNLGTSYVLSGRPEEALKPLDTAMRLSPYDIFDFHAWGEKSVAFYMMGEWDAAMDAADRSLQLRPGYWYAHAVKIGSLARGDRRDAARASLHRFLSRRPDFDHSYVDWLMFPEDRWKDHLLDGLRMAGWDEAGSKGRIEETG